MDNIKSRKKPRAVVRAREDIAAALRILDWPLQKIGTLMKKDHSAIVLMLRRVAKRGAGNTP
jgi:chromosomal replication initiation ATPase DnaA